MRNSMARTLASVAVAGAVVAVSGAVQADAPGQSFWVPGQVASFSAMPANAGWTVTLQPYYTSGDISKNLGGSYDSKSLKYETDNSVLQGSLLYGIKDTWMGGRVTLGLTTGVGKQSATLSTTDGLAHSDSASGALTSINPYTSIAWRDDSSSYMLYLTGAIPAGGYDSNKLTNLSLGYGAIDGGGAYSYFNRKSGLEISLLGGATYNWTNDNWIDNNQYQNGADWHVDWSLSQFVSPHVSIGAAGYAYGQFNDDKLNGISMGNSRSHIAGAGPQATYVFKVNNRDWSVNLRGYFEFWDQYRPSGYTAFLTLTMPLGTF